MNKLQLPQAKLLWAVSEAYRRRKVDQTQKRMLKQRIITDNVQIYQILDQCNDNQTQLIEKIVSLVKQPESVDENPQKQIQVVKQIAEQQEASSPWGQFLRGAKRKRQHEHKNQVKNLQSLMHKAQ